MGWARRTDRERWPRSPGGPGSWPHDNDSRPHSRQRLGCSVGTGEDANTRANWRHCFACSVLFFNGYADQGQYGLCPHDHIYGHTAAEYDFAIPVSACRA